KVPQGPGFARSRGGEVFPPEEGCEAERPEEERFRVASRGGESGGRDGAGDGAACRRAEDVEKRRAEPGEKDRHVRRRMKAPDDRETARRVDEAREERLRFVRP